MLDSEGNPPGGQTTYKISTRFLQPVAVVVDGAGDEAGLQLADRFLFEGGLLVADHERGARGQGRASGEVDVVRFSRGACVHGHLDPVVGQVDLGAATVEDGNLLVVLGAFEVSTEHELRGDGGGEGQGYSRLHNG